MRDQQWALRAYDAVIAVAALPVRDRKDYKNGTDQLGFNILRSGLVAAIAMVQRLPGQSRLLLGHLASAEITGLEHATADDLPSRIRALDVDAYILATREMLQFATWLKRAAQATLGDD